ncbi:zinc-binding dehydrogenase [Salinigranum marinum]|uniref:zinc-binding dehydrogenase n=1 Tax=Salinigranum marinum TaxID=1515595 RepID=UPI002989A11B|nr:zinc-binding dehydrogenase [Salinigranum marinum]
MNRMRSLRNGGRIIISGATAGPNPDTEIRHVFVRQLEVIGSTQNSQRDIEEIMQYVWDGRVEPIVQAMYPLEEYAEAFEKMADRDLYGELLPTQRE